MWVLWLVCICPLEPHAQGHNIQFSGNTDDAPLKTTLGEPVAGNKEVDAEKHLFVYPHLSYIWLWEVTVMLCTNISAQGNAEAGGVESRKGWIIYALLQSAQWCREKAMAKVSG